jgi:hypothetical protein
MHPQLSETPVERETKEVQIEVVRDVGGRPLFFTPRRFIRICRHIEEGSTISQACRLELVTYNGFRKHVKRNPSYQRRLKEAEKIHDEVLRDYALEMVKKAMPRNWVAAITFLERKWPNEFALRTVNRNTNSADQAIGDKIDESQLRRYAALMEDFRRENEAKAPAVTPGLPNPDSAGA